MSSSKDSKNSKNCKQSKLWKPLQSKDSKDSKQITIVNEWNEEIEIRLFRNKDKLSALSIALKETKIMGNSTKDISIPKALKILQIERYSILCMTKKNNYLLKDVSLNSKVIITAPDVPDLEQFDHSYQSLSKMNGFLHYKFNNINVAL